MRQKYETFLQFLDYMNKNNYKDIVIRGGVIYLLYGLRPYRDIDILMRKQYPIQFTGASVESFYQTPDRSQYILFNNPILTLYFKGFRVITLRADIFITRYPRAKHFQHPSALVDILMIRKRIDPSVEIPFDIRKLSNVERAKVRKNIKFRYNSKYNPFNEI